MIKKKWQESNAEARTQIQNETKYLQAIAFELQKYNQLLDSLNMDGSYDYSKAVKGRIETIVEAFGKC